MASSPPDDSILPEGWTWGDVGHGALDIAGLVPLVGEAADLANAGWYAAEGQYLEAGLSIVSMVPVVGDAIGKGGKLAKKSAGKLAGPAIKALKGMDFKKMLEPLAKHPKIDPHIDKIAEALEKWRKDIVGAVPPCTPAGKQMCPLVAKRVDELTDRIIKGGSEQAAKAADELAKMSTSTVGGSNRVVLGKWPDYIKEAKKNGGAWFETPPGFFDKLKGEVGEEASERAWQVNEAFLRQQLATGKSIEITGEGLAHAINRPNSMMVREMGFLMKNAKQYGYTRIGNGKWVKRN